MVVDFEEEVSAADAGDPAVEGEAGAAAGAKRKGKEREICRTG